MRRRGSRPAMWGTRAGQFVRWRTVPGLVDELRDRGIQVTRCAVYHWVHGRYAPTFEALVAIKEISHGRVGLDEWAAQRRIAVRMRVRGGGSDDDEQRR